MRSLADRVLWACTKTAWFTALAAIYLGATSNHQGIRGGL